MNVNIVYFINNLKFNLSRKNFYFDINVSIQLLKLLHLFQKLNVIRRFIQITPKRYRIFTSWSNQTSPSNLIKTHYRGLNPIVLKLSALKILKTQTFNSYLILNTSKGVMTHVDAVNARVGGTLLCTVY